MDAISVSVRVRPLNQSELNNGQGSTWQLNNDSITQCDASGKPMKPSTFRFDHIFGTNSRTLDVYNTVAGDLVSSAMNGVNGTIFAYGQTSSGKTFTMGGTSSEMGIIPLAIQDVFRHISASPDREFLLRVSYLELYNEVISDLLVPSSTNLKIRLSANGDNCVTDLSEEVVVSPQQILELMRLGEKNRHTGKTNMNERSSRSHTVFRMVIESRAVKGDGDSASTESDAGSTVGVPAADRLSGDGGAVLVSTLNLVDLAGSERSSQTGAEGVRLKEGSSINKSLLTLGMVIRELSEGTGAEHIPYRNSKLTRILQSSLGGNARTSIVCTISPAFENAEQTLGTLRFATGAKTVKNKPIVNEVRTDETQLRRYETMIADLRRQLEERRKPKRDEVVKVQEHNEALQQELREREKELTEQAAKIERFKKLFLVGSAVNPEMGQAVSAELGTTVIPAGTASAVTMGLSAKAMKDRRGTWFAGATSRAQLVQPAGGVSDSTADATDASAHFAPPASSRSRRSGVRQSMGPMRQLLQQQQQQQQQQSKSQPQQQHQQQLQPGMASSNTSVRTRELEQELADAQEQIKCLEDLLERSNQNLMTTIEKNEANMTPRRVKSLRSRLEHLEELHKQQEEAADVPTGLAAATVDPETVASLERENAELRLQMNEALEIQELMTSESMQLEEQLRVSREALAALEKETGLVREEARSATAAEMELLYDDLADTQEAHEQLEAKMQQAVESHAEAMAAAETKMQQMTEAHVEALASLEAAHAMAVASVEEAHAEALKVFEHKLAQAEETKANRVAALEEQVETETMLVGHKEQELLTVKDELAQAVSSAESLRTALAKMEQEKQEQIGETVSRLESELESVKQEMTMKMEETAVMARTEMDALQEQLASVTDERTQAQQQLSETQQEMAIKMKQLASMTDERTQVQQQMSETQQEMSIKMEEAAALASVEMDEVQKQLEAVREECAQLQEQLGVCQSDAERVQQELRDEMEEAAVMARTEVEEVQEQLTSVMTEKEQLAEKLGRTEAELAEIRGDLGDSISQVVELQEQIEEMSGRVAQGEEAITLLKTESEAKLSEASERVASLSEQLDRMRGESGSIGLRVGELEQEKVEWETEREIFSEEKSVWELEKAELEEENAKLQMSLESAREDQVALQTAFEEERTSLKQAVESAEMAVDQLKSQQLAAQEKIEALESATSSANVKVAATETELESERAGRAAERAEWAQLKERAEEQEREIEEKAALIDEAESSLVALQTAVEKGEEHCDALKEQLQRVEERAAGLHTELVSNKARMDEAEVLAETERTRRERIEDELQSKVDAVADVNETASNLVKALEAEQAKCKTQEAELQRVYEELTDANLAMEEMQAGRGNDRRDERDLSEELVSMRMALEEALCKSTALEKEKEELRRSNRRAERDTESLRKQLKEMEADMEDVESGKNSEIARLQTIVDELEVDLMIVRKQQETAEASRKPGSSVEVEMAEALAETTRQLEEMQTMKREMEEQLEQSGADRVRLRGERDAVQKSVDGMRVTVAEMKKRVEVSERERDALGETVTRLVGERERMEKLKVAAERETKSLREALAVKEMPVFTSSVSGTAPGAITGTGGRVVTPKVAKKGVSFSFDEDEENAVKKQEAAWKQPASAVTVKANTRQERVKAALARSQQRPAAPAVAQEDDQPGDCKQQ